MGTHNAQGFAEQVAEGNISLRAALSWHLQANHFPALPQPYIEVAEQAIDAANEERWDDWLVLPKAVLQSGVIPRSAVDDEELGVVRLRVFDAVQILHLDAFIQQDESEEDDQ